MLALFSLPLLTIGLIILYLIVQGIYNVFFHPLRHYPGPLLNRSNRLVWTYHAWNGNAVKHTTALHEQYGETVRVNPNELSYINAQAWQDIHGHRTISGQSGNLPKEMYSRRPEQNGAQNILGANESDHRRMRRLQSHMFSEKALKAQELLITSHVDKLIKRLHQQSQRPQTPPVDLVMWYNYTTFDILGDLAFGDSFGCLESDVLHPWIVNLFQSLKDFNFYRIARPFPFPIFHLMRKLQPTLKNARAEEFAFASQRARERMSQGSTGRVDFMSYILKYNDEKGMTSKEIESNASILILAGSETTATFLSGITFNLLRTPHVLKKLTELVRTTFPLECDIDMKSVEHLRYFTDCLEEGLRTYPPIPSGLPRITINEGSIIAGRFVPPGTIVYVTQWAAYQSANNFANPEAFVPERWAKNPPARYANDNRNVLQPFSCGPRNCIGRNLAYAEMRLVLARVLWNFDLELHPDSLNWSSQKIWLLWEKPPLYVKLIPRKA